MLSSVTLKKVLSADTQKQTILTYMHYAQRSSTCHLVWTVLQRILLENKKSSDFQG